VRSRADARDTHFPAAQIFQPLDLGLGENALGQMILDTGDEHQIVVAAHHRAHQTDPTVNQ
jgi:hypothetical protein